MTKEEGKKKDARREKLNKTFHNVDCLVVGVDQFKVMLHLAIYS